MQNKKEALQEILTIAEAHKITAADITAAFLDPASLRKAADTDRLLKFFGYLGSSLVFSGICIFLTMQWDSLNSISRVLVTLGAGFAAFLMALASLKDDRYRRAATPLFAIAVFLETCGLAIVLDEYGMGGDKRYGLLFISFVMLVQQVFTFLATRQTVLAFMSLFFFCAFCQALTNILGIYNQYTIAIFGIIILKAGHLLQKTPNKELFPACMFFGGMMTLYGAFRILKHLDIEVLFLGVSVLMLFISVTLRSRALLIISTIAMFSYVTYFTSENFSQTVGWPLSLMFIGFALIGLGITAVRINEKYMRR